MNCYSEDAVVVSGVVGQGLIYFGLIGFMTINIKLRQMLYGSYNMTRLVIQKSQVGTMFYNMDLHDGYDHHERSKGWT